MRAILSVSDKTGLVELSRSLVGRGVQLISTGGTAKAIAAAGLPVIAGGSDGAMASLGTGIAVPGQMVITVGTSGAVRKIVSEPWFDPGERTFCYLLTDQSARFQSRAGQ